MMESRDAQKSAFRPEKRPRAINFSSCGKSHHGEIHGNLKPVNPPNSCGYGSKAELSNKFQDGRHTWNIMKSDQKVHCLCIAHLRKPDLSPVPPQTKKPETQSLALSSERLNMLNGPKPWTMGINDLHVLRPILASTYCIHPSVHPSIHPSIESTTTCFSKILQVMPMAIF